MATPNRNNLRSPDANRPTAGKSRVGDRAGQRTHTAPEPRGSMSGAEARAAKKAPDAQGGTYHDVKGGVDHPRHTSDGLKRRVSGGRK